MVSCEDTTMTIWTRLLWTTQGFGLGLFLLLLVLGACGPLITWQAILFIEWFAIQAYAALVVLVISLYGLWRILTHKSDDNRGPR